MISFLARPCCQLAAVRARKVRELPVLYEVGKDVGETTAGRTG